jgi:hypothetical protein
MQTKSLNPLSKHFRQPAIYLSLPSQGRYWENNSLELPVNGEIAIYPMTARDEITLRTPDALLNGQGVIDVIQSCCPNIINAWHMPSIDVDATLIAIRIASYGNAMAINSKCTHCGESNSVSIDLGSVIASISVPDYNQRLDCGDSLHIKLRPQAYFSMNKTSQIRYEEQKILASLSDQSVTEEIRLQEYSKHMQTIVELNLKILVDSTEYIDTSGEVVTDKAYIADFYNNCPTGIVKQVQHSLQNILESSKTNSILSTCDSCGKEYSIVLEFDQASFFDSGS